MPRKYFPDRGDLVWLEFSPQSGPEQSGKRPALILSPRAYNAKVGLALVCPITSRAKGYPFEVPLPDRGKVKGVILADQVRSLDWRSRKAKLIQKCPAEIVESVQGKVLLLVS